MTCLSLHSGPLAGLELTVGLDVTRFVVLRELGSDPVDILFYTMLVVGVAFIAAAAWTLSGS